MMTEETILALCVTPKGCEYSQELRNPCQINPGPWIEIWHAKQQAPALHHLQSSLCCRVMQTAIGLVQMQHI